MISPSAALGIWCFLRQAFGLPTCRRRDLSLSWHCDLSSGRRHRHSLHQHSDLSSGRRCHPSLSRRSDIASCQHRDHFLNRRLDLTSNSDLLASYRILRFLTLHVSMGFTAVTWTITP
ncbi:hypothetical protein DsansV1_C09g0091171 [Dioscorea sansibarensis]